MGIRGVLASVLVVLPVLAGCSAGSSGGSTPTAAPSGTPSSATPSAVPTPSASTPSLVVITDDGLAGEAAGAPGGVPKGTGPRSGDPRGADPIPVLRGMRAAAQKGFDRVVLEFDGPVPGYRAEYVPQVVEDATGEPVELSGKAFLQVAVQTATMDDAVQGGSRVYGGPVRLTPKLDQVREVLVAGDFEGVLTVGLGLDARRGFRVTALSGPSRLVIDVAR